MNEKHFLGLRTVFLVLSFKLKSWSFKIDYKKLYYMFIFIFIDILRQFKCLTSDMQVSLVILGIISNLTVATGLYRTTLKINNTINKQITVTNWCQAQDCDCVEGSKVRRVVKNHCNVRESNPGLPRGRREFYH